MSAISYPKRKKEDKKILWGIYGFTVIVYALVIILHELPSADTIPTFAYFLPKLNAFINGTCAVLLLSSLVAIKNKKVSLHQNLNTTAMVLSVVFLLSYVLYHYFVGDTSYQGEYKGLYYFVLISHVLLAGLSLPAILVAYYRGWIGDIQKHRKIVKITFPVWLYVTITGVLVYLFLAPFYPA